MYPRRVRVACGLRRIWPTRLMVVGPAIRFLFVGAAIRLRIPTDPASRRAPLPSAIRFGTTSARWRLPLQTQGMPGTIGIGGSREGLLTSRSAGRPNSAMPASPFQASGETSPGKNDDLPRTIAGSTPLPLGRRSFAVSGPLAPVRSASYPVPVRRLTGSFHASFSVRLTTNALRFPSVPATRFREDFHLQVIAHAGPTSG